MAERIRRCLSGAQLLFNGGELLRAVMNFFHRSRNAPATFWRCDRAFIWRPPEETSYLAVARRVILQPPEERSYLAVARKVIWRPPEELRGSVKNNLEFLYMRQTISSMGFFV